MHPKAKDMTTPLEVGEKYWVECVYRLPPWIVSSDKASDGDWLPVFGDLHADNLEVSVSEWSVDRLHIHIDMRFVTDRQIYWHNFCLKRPYAKWYQKNMKSHLSTRCQEEGCQNHIQAKWMYLTCIRQWDSYKHKQWSLPELRKKLSNYCINPEKPVCPHQRFDLSTVEPTMIDGRPVVICPGHLLGWCMQTGKLVPEHNPKE